MNAQEKERYEEGMFMSQRSTPRSEQRRSAYGSLEMSVQTSRGLCTRARKCVLRNGHETAHWPHD